MQTVNPASWTSLDSQLEHKQEEPAIIFTTWDFNPTLFMICLLCQSQHSEVFWGIFLFLVDQHCFRGLYISGDLNCLKYRVSNAGETVNSWQHPVDQRWDFQRSKTRISKLKSLLSSVYPARRLHHCRLHHCSAHGIRENIQWKAGSLVCLQLLPKHILFRSIC